ncbi:MAG: membrane protein necessary for nodulation/competitiveness [Bdellovibrio sp. ArHS]|uniref:NfeD family protein n=1 Tax=Bdellovibrio sp. ArHS TaxID=1569284 RepID=UPI000582E16D|nr:nodulation protein NfeD [Bdellovibrio sp. ArHS]KHD89579.1 MAG: membrane protein necessary for nodulation/competitiveness [Bdellovibrio sp. ArHS]
MKKTLIALFILFMFSLQAQATCTLAVTINDAITASTSDYLARAESIAKDNRCEALFVRMNTPGGSLQSTRLIVEQILRSEIPYLCLITPSGGGAGSAGAIILQACHVNGGLTATNIGAATPILGTGENTPEDLRKKIINDTVSWMEGVTQLRGRNLDFAKEIVTEAKSLSSEAAHKAKALDILAQNEMDFLKQAEGRKVLVNEKKEFTVKVSELREFSPDLRYKVLSFVADPEFAYLLFMGSLGLLYVEITHPGLIAPGVIGGIGLVLSLVAFHKLDIVWGGLALILLGIVFLILEIFVTSFGLLGIGGLVAVFVGSLFLFDAQATGYTLPLSLILSVVAVLGFFFLGIGYLALKTIRHKSKDADADLASHKGVVVAVEALGHRGQIQIMGETWFFVSEDSLQVNDQVQVTGRQGLTLNVKKVL